MPRPFLIVFLSLTLFANEDGKASSKNESDLRFVCGTARQSPEQIWQSKFEVDEWLMQRENREQPTYVLVIFHVIHASNGVGNVPESQILNQMEWMSSEYEEHQIFFILDSINRVENDTWFEGWSTQNMDAPGMQALSHDPAHYLNIYTASLSEQGSNFIVGGYCYFPTQYPEGHYRQGFTLDYRSLPGGAYNWPKAAVHEGGHYFGLYHTFETNCSLPDDAVDDTPRNDENSLHVCNSGLDSCPDDPGNDPVYNYMTYSGTNCPDHFTEGQSDRMHAIIAQYHPSLLENSPNYPTLYVNELSYQNDTDGDGVFNPGEVVRIRANIGNLYGASAEGVLAVLSTEDDRISILDDSISFDNSIESGEVSFTLFDWFEVYAHPDAALGNITANLNISTSSVEYPYEIDEEVTIKVSLNQAGFPLDYGAIKSSPLIADLYGNSYLDIFYGDEDGELHGFSNSGDFITGFPFTSGDKIRSSPAIGDVDNDGANEIVFGSYDGNLYILSVVGTQEHLYAQNGYIIGSPALADLDGDQDMEIIFTTQRGSNSGELFAIHHDGTDVDGFPADIDEKMLVGPAVGDLEGDGIIDIVICTWSDNIYALDAMGVVKSGFPYASTNRFNAPPTLIDVDNDGDLEIVAGNDSGLLHVLHHDGTEMASFDTGDDIRGGISVGDLNEDGSYELLFSGYDDHLHVWNPVSGEELDGWPVDLGSNSLSEPITVDLDNDGDLEVVAANKTGTLYVFHHDGTSFPPFPTNIPGNIESSLAVGDIDLDGDYEIAIGTTSGGLIVMDIKSELGDRVSWKLHRGNKYRTGSLGMTLLSSEVGETALPTEFRVSPNYPNPFNPSTSINIETVTSGKLLVHIYDVSGRIVNTLVNTNMNPGYYTVKWNGQNKQGEMMPTGIYFIQVEAGNDLGIRKIMLIK